MGKPLLANQLPLLPACLALFCLILIKLYGFGGFDQQTSGSAVSPLAQRLPAAAAPAGGNNVPCGASGAVGAAAAAAAGSFESHAVQQPTWEQVAEALAQPSGLHGRLAKGGMPADWRRLLAHMTNRRAELHGLPEAMTPELYRWLGEVYAFSTSTGRSNCGLQSPVPPCHFYVDHTYRLLYVRSAKTASTSVTQTLGMKENPKMCNMSALECYKKCEGRPMCMEYLWNATELRNAWPEYTVFAFVRNPWARAVSSWLHAHKKSLQPECHDDFPRFAAAPSAYAAKCLLHPACCRKKFGWMLEHVEPQAQCLFDTKGQPAVDFIGRVEHMDEDMQALLDLINARRPNGTVPLAVAAMPRLMVAEDDAEAAKDEEERRRRYAELYLGSSALQDVRNYFHEDFSRLRFTTALPGLQHCCGDGGGDAAAAQGSSSGLGG